MMAESLYTSTCLCHKEKKKVQTLLFYPRPRLCINVHSLQQNNMVVMCSFPEFPTCKATFATSDSHIFHLSKALSFHITLLKGTDALFAITGVPGKNLQTVCIINLHKHSKQQLNTAMMYRSHYFNKLLLKAKISSN